MFSERRGETIREASWEDIDPPSKQFVFNKLNKETENLAPGDSLSNHLRCLIERFSRGERREIVSRTVNGCAPLFKVCKVGNTEVVEYLITTCDADVEQKGLYEDSENHSVAHVAPLWRAAVAGKLDVVKCLIQHGADVNSVSDQGSTAVKGACFESHFDIVKFLVENGANINKRSYLGGTCLINSLQSVALCEYLIKNGADVNSQNIENDTALHQAIYENEYETTKLLLEHGANPFLTNKYNDDALQTACINGAKEIFQYLTENFEYEPKRLAEGYELLGSTFLHDKHNDMQLALKYWRKAANVRQKHNLEKQVKAPCKAFQYVKEFRNLEELETLSCDQNLVQIQDFLICERILGKSHFEVLYRLMHRGAKYRNSLQYQNCINLWLYALQLKINRNTILFSDTCLTAKSLVCLYMYILKEYKSGNTTYKVSFEDAFETLELISSELPEAMKLLKIKPVFKEHQSIFDTILKVLMHVIYVLFDISRTEGQKHRLAVKVNRILQLDPRTNEGGFSLLHLSAIKPNAIFNPNFSEDGHMKPFPSMKVFVFLMKCGAHENALTLEEGLSSFNIA